RPGGHRRGEVEAGRRSGQLRALDVPRQRERARVRPDGKPPELAGVELCLVASGGRHSASFESGRRRRRARLPLACGSCKRDDHALMLKDFKAFVLRGNMIELAVAVVIGVAFTALITALVADLITPLIA